MPADPVTQPELYTKELLDGLGDQDPLDVLAGTPGALEDRIGPLGQDELAERPREGAWSVKEILGHLGDTEWVYGYRVRLILSHDKPPMPGYDQDLMVTGMAHFDRPVSMLMEEFRRLRGLNLDLYRRTRGPAWDRVGVHAERGEESVDLNIRLLAGHDLRHLGQIDRTLDAVRG